MKPEILNQELSTTFVQTGDGNSPDDQFLTIKSEECGADNYFVIETERWAFDKIDELIELLNQFKDKCEKLK